MNILLISTLTALIPENFIISFKKRGHNVEALNISHGKSLDYLDLGSYGNFYNISNLNPQDFYASLNPKNTSLYRIWPNLFKRVFRIPRKALKKRILEVLNSNSFDVIFSLWGPFFFNIQKVILDLKDRPPMIHYFEDYPTVDPINMVFDREIGKGLPKLGKLDPEVIPRLDGRVVHGKYMLEYIKKRLDLSYGINAVMETTYWDSTYFPDAQREKISLRDGEPHLGFFGRTDFEYRRISHPCDDVRCLIEDLCDNKIHIHVYSPRTKRESETEEEFVIDQVRSMGFSHANKYLHIEERKRPLGGKFAESMTQFDGCIVLYDVNKRTYGFVNRAHTRFHFPLISGIPMIQPADVFSTSEDFIKKYQIGFSYRSFDDLKTQLNDKRKMALYTKNALKMNESFQFDNHIDKLENFMLNVIERFRTNSLEHKRSLDEEILMI